MIVNLILRRYNVCFMALLTNLLTRAGDLSGRYQEVVSIRYLSTTSIFLKRIAGLYHLYNREIPVYQISAGDKQTFLSQNETVIVDFLGNINDSLRPMSCY